VTDRVSHLHEISSRKFENAICYQMEIIGLLEKSLFAKFEIIAILLKDVLSSSSLQEFGNLINRQL
jgi:hypothetical protein